MLLVPAPSAKLYQMRAQDLLPKSVCSLSFSAQKVIVYSSRKFYKAYLISVSEARRVLKKDTSVDFEEGQYRTLTRRDVGCRD